LQRAEALKAPAIYVKKGLLRSYIIDSSGKEHIYMFASEGWIIGDIEAIEYDQPAQLFIDCLEDSEVLLFNNKSLFKADLSREQIEENVQLLSRRIGRLQRRVLMLMGAQAIDRYKYFLEIYPELPNRVPQKMIASYLGIMPQTLSTLRNKIAHSK
jgi:CRP-like cAMP-binding protein